MSYSYKHVVREATDSGKEKERRSLDRSPPLAKRLKQARLRRGLSQTRLGVAAGIDVFSASSRLNQYERGKRFPDFCTAERLAQVLNCPVSFFFIREDDLAEMMLVIHDLPPPQRGQLLAKLLRDRQASQQATDGSG